MKENTHPNLHREVLAENFNLKLQVQLGYKERITPQLSDVERVAKTTITNDGQQE